MNASENPAILRWREMVDRGVSTRRELLDAGDALAAALEASEKRADLVTGGLARATAALEAAEERADELNRENAMLEAERDELRRWNAQLRDALERR